MNKILIAFALLTCCLLLPAAGDRFFASAGAAALFPGDSVFKSYYGKVQFSPELRAGCNLSKNFYLWLGCGFLASRGEVPVLKVEAKSSQYFLSLGTGWETRRGRRWQADVFAALLLAGFREEAMGVTASKSALGLEVGTGLRYFLQKRLFLGAAVSYAGAGTTVRFAEKDKDIILGGLRLSARVGFRF
jgi:hypothetical protein